MRAVAREWCATVTSALWLVPHFSATLSLNFIPSFHSSWHTMAFKIGFGAANNKNKKPLASSKPLLNDDEDEDAQPKSSNVEEVGGIPISQLDSTPSEELPDRPSLKAKPKPGLPLSQYGDLSAQRAHAQTQQKALEVDAAIYDYDAAFDAIHTSDNARKLQRKKEAEERKSRYMDNFLSAAETRKQDLARAKDKQLQREREAEGDAYADKEKFVTEAYKKQQEEIRQAEEVEKTRQREEEEKRRKMVMQGFYQGVMDEREKRYQEAVKAAEDAAKNGAATGGGDAEKEKSDAQIAEELRKQGKDVLLNEEGQIVDKRETLSAGLNIIAKPKAASTAPRAESKISAQHAAWQSRGIGNQKDRRDRQTRMIEEQLAQAAKRAADDEAEEQRKLEHASKSRKTEGEIGSAKERYLARKKAAEEAKKAGKT